MHHFTSTSVFALTWCAWITGSTAAAFATPLVLEVEAFVDGRDHLLIQGATVQWHHFDFAAVGRINGLNEPTYLTTSLHGDVSMDRVPWIPDWPQPPPAEIRYEAWSSVFTGLTPVVPTDPDLLGVTLTAIQARESVSLIQSPGPNNGYTTIVEFDDFDSSGPDWYHCEPDVRHRAGARDGGSAFDRVAVCSPPLPPLAI